jgi:hypothetical protein
LRWLGNRYSSVRVVWEVEEDVVGGGNHVVGVLGVGNDHEHG